MLHELHLNKLTINSQRRCRKRNCNQVVSNHYFRLSSTLRLLNPLWDHRPDDTTTANCRLLSILLLHWTKDCSRLYKTGSLKRFTTFFNTSLHFHFSAYSNFPISTSPFPPYLRAIVFSFSLSTLIYNNARNSEGSEVFLHQSVACVAYKNHLWNRCNTSKYPCRYVHKTKFDNFYPNLTANISYAKKSKRK